MRTVTIIGALALLFCGFWMQSFAGQQSIEGDWIGGFEIRERYTFVKARFTGDGSGTKATIDIQFPLRERKTGLALTGLSLKSSRVHFELPKDTGTLIFDGTINDGTISGEVQQAGLRNSFHLTRIVTVNPKILDEYSGLYQLEPNRFISVGGRGSPDSLGCTDFKAERFRPLFPVSETTFFAGPALFVTFPIELKITFTKNKQGQVTGLIWQENGSSGRSAPKVDLYKDEEVSFRNGDITLAGTLSVPSAKGPHPAVIMIGHGPRNSYVLLSRLFVSHGIAVLRYDKRGEGASTGRPGQPAFDDQAADALAAIQSLKSRNDIRPQHIGLWGGSQAGWIAQVAASRSKDVAFIITVSGPGVPPWQQELYRVENRLREDGFSAVEVAEAMAFFRRKFKVARTGQGWEQLAADAQEARNTKWFAYHGLPTSLDELQWSWKHVWSYDPMTVLEKVTCPVLAIFGGLDRDVPVKESVSRIEQALKNHGNKDYTIKVFPNGDHSLVEMITGSREDMCCIKGPAPGYYETMIDWIVKWVAVKK